MIKAMELFQLSGSLSMFADFFRDDAYPWEWLPEIEKALLAYEEKDGLKKYISKWCQFLKLLSPSIRIGKNVHIGKNVKLPVTCTIEDNVFIGDHTEIRSGALIRKNVIIGDHCVIGNSCEIKNSLLMDYVQVAHFNYVGDSILGPHTHLSAGAILSNLRFDNQLISVKYEGEKIPTGLRKFGAILGEGAQVGCNAVLLPGTILGKNSVVSVGTVFGGILESNQIIYTQQNNIVKT